jgi:RHS repeat-associated protein
MLHHGSLTAMGFTGHEFLEDFNLYNMNGRLYDPILGRFLSPDPYIADPSFTQSYNRYSYVLNNPLKNNDPTGELPLWALWGIASAGNWLFGGMDNWLNKGMSFKQSFSTANNPIVFSDNYHPGSNSWSNSQVNAHRLVGAMANAERGVHSYVAGFNGMGCYPEGPLFTTTPFDQFVGDSPLAGGVAQSFFKTYQPNEWEEFRDNYGLLGKAGYNLIDQAWVTTQRMVFQKQPNQISHLNRSGLVGNELVDAGINTMTNLVPISKISNSLQISKAPLNVAHFNKLYKGKGINSATNGGYFIRQTNYVIRNSYNFQLVWTGIGIGGFFIIEYNND